MFKAGRGAATTSISLSTDPLPAPGFDIDMDATNSSPSHRQSTSRDDLSALVITGGTLLSLPVLDMQQWSDLVFHVVWTTGRMFGFQAFNLDPATRHAETPQWVAATLFLAADHLVALIRDAYLRDKLSTADEERFARAVWEVHGAVLCSYETNWAPLVGLKPRLKAADEFMRTLPYNSYKVLHGLLVELSVFFLMYTEGACMRHFSDGSLFFFWAAMHSPAVGEAWDTGLPQPADVPPRGRERCLRLRTDMQDDIRRLCSVLHHDASRQRPEYCAGLVGVAQEAILAGTMTPQSAGHLFRQHTDGSSSSGGNGRLAQVSVVGGADAALLADLVAFGDGGFYCDRIVTPLFSFLSHEMDGLFYVGEETAHRIGYDDINESLCDARTVEATLKLLKLSGKDELRGGGVPHGAWAALTRLGCPDSGTRGGEEADGLFDAQTAANFWSAKVVVKTYRERRSWLAVWRAFYRVFALQVVLFHILLAHSFAPSNLHIISSAVLTHAFCHALERLAAWVMTRHPADPLESTRTRTAWAEGKDEDDMMHGRQKKAARRAAAQARKAAAAGPGGPATPRGSPATPRTPGGQRVTTPHAPATPKTPCTPRDVRNARRQVVYEGAPVLGVFGVLEWWLVAIGVTAIFALQYIEVPGISDIARQYWLYLAGGYSAVHLAHWVLTTRDGYCISLTGAMRLPRFFSAHSARPRPTSWVHGTMKVGWGVFLVNALFWVAIFAVKIVFDYYVLTKPLVGPIRVLLGRHWLGCSTSHYLIGGQESAIPCIGGDWILVTARVLPFLLISIVDTTIIYQVLATIFGLAMGLLRLNVGVMGDWTDLVREFHRGPNRWWSKCLSETGQANQRASLALGGARAWEGFDATAAAEFGEEEKMQHHGRGAVRTGRRAGRAVVQVEALMEMGDEQDDALTVLPRVSSMGSMSRSSSAPLFPPFMADGDELERMGGSGGQSGSNCASSVSGSTTIVAGTAVSDQTDSSAAAAKDGNKRAAKWQSKAYKITLMQDQGGQQMAKWLAFSFAWDEIVKDLRAQDLISDREVSLLRFIHLGEAARATGLRPLLLPVFFYSGQVQRVVDSSTLHSAQAVVLSELRYLSVWLLYELGVMSMEQSSAVMVAGLVAALLDQHHSVARRNLFKAAVRLMQVREFVSAPGALASCLSWLQPQAGCEGSGEWRLLVRIVETLLGMLTTSGRGAQPAGAEAQRILCFFMNTLANPELGAPPGVDEQLSHTVLTPCYEEDVLYPLDAEAVSRQMDIHDPRLQRGLTDLVTETEDSVCTMAYLRSVFPKDWENFKERLGHTLGGVDLAGVTEENFKAGGPLAGQALQLQLWASNRGQLLARTVRGMMCYQTALRVLVQLEHPRPLGIPPRQYKEFVDKLVAAKFQYVVTSQNYGRYRHSSEARLRWLSTSVDILMQQFPQLQVAFLDSTVHSDGPCEFSVLMRARQGHEAGDAASANEELYRVRLPANRYSHRGIIIGEGKPENQNHAVIFCFGEGLQTIDMNQDNTVSEAYKMRNLLSELVPSGYVAGSLAAVCNPKDPNSPMTAANFQQIANRRRAAVQPTALVGFREWIFSDKAGALGSFAASAELAFGTIVQRVMDWPGRCRMHYGHPDVWNKLHMMAHGGMSKASRQLHISEDVFGGYAHTLRGAAIKYREYIAVGKGRDMGFDAINGFEIKISGGSGEVMTSRDVLRLGTRFDIFRLMFFYHSGNGYYINTLVLMWTVYLNIFALLLFALSDSASLLVGQNDPVTGELVEYKLQDTLRLEAVLQLGTLTIVPYMGQLLLELGALRMVVTVVMQILAGSLAFFIFKQQTTAFYFNDDITYGGARYIGTGRGFSISSSEFVKVFANYGRTHCYLGFELLFMVITLYTVGGCADCNYGAMTWGTWMVAVSLVLAPFWFNPLTFSVSKVKRDWRAFGAWLHGEDDRDTGDNWFTWNRKQLEKVRDDKGSQTDMWLTRVSAVLGQCTAPALLALAAVSRLDIQVTIGPDFLRNSYLIFLILTAFIWGAALLTVAVQRRFINRARGRQLRIYQICLFLVLAGLLGGFLGVSALLYSGSGALNLLLVLYANLYILLALHRAATHCCTRSPASRALVDAGYWVLDFAVGYLLLSVIAILSFIRIVARLQAVLLFNTTFAKSVRRGKLVKTIGLRKAEVRSDDAPSQQQQQQ